jgi:hypothetical protein
MRKSGEIEHSFNPSAAISAILGAFMTMTEKSISTVIDCVGETPGENVNYCPKNIDAGSNGENVDQHKQIRVEVDSTSADQLLWRYPQCSYTNNKEISRTVFGDTDIWA